MLVTIPLRWRVVSVHWLYTATSSVPCRRMSYSTVSDVKEASSPDWCAWMSCDEGGDSVNKLASLWRIYALAYDERSSCPCKPPAGTPMK